MKKKQRPNIVATCALCNHTLDYSEPHDADYCAHCNDWREENCEDPECEYCKDRPEKPLNKIRT